MSNNTQEEEETTRSQKRDTIETDEGPISSTESSDPKPVEGRIPKKQKTSSEDDPVAIARKALEMFKEIEAEDAPTADTTESTKENVETKTETKMKTQGSPRMPKIHHRLPIISQQPGLLL
mmetsp:Transcript_18380/g.45565  ORF Transcript_18380/g.45565 Transcript_18380/m.45565 type:complete len:121 (+) Transcript_18380:154-516(+)